MRATAFGGLAVAGLFLAACSSAPSTNTATGGSTPVTSATPATSAAPGGSSGSTGSAGTATGRSQPSGTTKSNDSAGADTAEFKTSGMRAFLQDKYPDVAAQISKSGGVTISDSSSDPRRGSATLTLVDGSDQAAALAACEAVSAWAYPIKSESTVQIKVGNDVVVKRVSEAGTCAPSSG